MRRRLQRLRAGGDEGSVLVLALAFLLAFGVLIGVVLQLAATGARTTVSVRDQGIDTYAGGGALDGAINLVRSDPTIGLAPAAASTCFTLPAGGLGNTSAVTVSCLPRSTSGAALGGSTAAQPGYAVTALSGTATEGVTVTSGTTTLQGGAAINKALTVALGATLDSTGYPVTAGSCLVLGTVKDACAPGGAVTDPGYPGPSTATAVQRTTLPACATTVTLQPGVYRSAAALQAVLSCTAATIVLATGTYYFDFQDASTHELLFAGTGRLIGGAVSGTSCDPTLPGVDLAFGGDSRLKVTGGKVDLCALVPLGDLTQQHVVLRGLTATTTVPTTATVVTTAGTSVGGTAWATPANGAVVDGATTTSSIAGNGKPDAILNVKLPTTVVPADATNISATITVRESLDTGSTSTLAATSAELLSPAGALVASRPLASCIVAGQCVAALRDDTTTSITGLTVAQLNGTVTPAALQVRLTKPGSSNVVAAIDGVTLNLTYDLPLRPACTLSAGACVAGSLPTSPLLTASGAYGSSTVGLHGTVYAPTSSIDLSLTSVTAAVVDRGVVVRHLVSSMTPAVGAPAMISVPAVGRKPRTMIMTATDAAGRVLGRADVTFADSAGTRNGDIPTVVDWFVN